MKLFAPLLILLALIFVSASPGHAACYADYKAKRDAPLKLHYGVAELSDADCGSKSAAHDALAPRLQKGDWTLLTILSIFGADGLEEKKASAGEYYLRY